MGLASDASIRIFPASASVAPNGRGFFMRNPAWLVKEDRVSLSLLIPVTEAALLTATGPNSTRDRIGRSWNISLEKRVY
jgi:hypothetical protein